MIVNTVQGKLSRNGLKGYVLCELDVWLLKEKIQKYLLPCDSMFVSSSATLSG